MNVYLTKDGELLRGDLIVRWVLRHDLAPMPRTVELTVRVKDGIEDRLKEGDVFWTGRENLKYRIVKTFRPQSSGIVQGSDVLGAHSLIAYLDMAHQIGFIRPRAIVRENATFGDLYRSCGATVPVGNDFTVRRFSCFKGMAPSFDLARALQEESGTLVLRNGVISFARLSDLMKQPPTQEISQIDSSDATNSEFLERHGIPSFFSIADDGSFVMGDFSKTRAVGYQPRSNERALSNMSRVLVTRRLVNSNIAPQINAGDTLNCDGQKQVVITAAHIYENGERGLASKSKFWVGELNQ